MKETVYRDKRGNGYDYFTYVDGIKVFMSSNMFWKMIQQGCDFVMIKH